MKKLIGVIWILSIVSTVSMATEYCSTAPNGDVICSEDGQITSITFGS